LALVVKIVLQVCFKKLLNKKVVGENPHYLLGKLIDKLRVVTGTEYNLGDTVRLLNDMHNIYIRAKKECNYNASRFLQMLSSNVEPVAIAKKLTLSSVPSDGFTKLWELKRLDLTVEALINNNEEYHKFFTESELDFIKEKLTNYGYL
jgi:hypothetical protein